jgi:prepilin-type N-terminal cleavage/methylation domain-containing protein
MSRHRNAFTLVEVLVVVIILGILAAIVIASFSHVTGDARVNSTLRQLQVIRNWVQLYKFDHTDAAPDLVTNQWDPLLLATDVDGTIDAAGAFGPYSSSIPKNPLNGNSVVAANLSGPDVGWIYDAATGAMQATNQTATVLFDETTGLVQ